MEDQIITQEEQEDLRPEEIIELQRALQEYAGAYPSPEEPSNLFTFFKKIFVTKDSSKVSYLDPNELFAVRTLQHTANLMDVLGYNEVVNYLNKKAETVLATSLSKNGAFIQAAITQKRQLETDRKDTYKGDKKKWKKPEQSQP